MQRESGGGGGGFGARALHADVISPSQNKCAGGGGYHGSGNDYTIAIRNARIMIVIPLEYFDVMDMKSLQKKIPPEFSDVMLAYAVGGEARLRKRCKSDKLREIIRPDFFDVTGGGPGGRFRGPNSSCRRHFFPQNKCIKTFFFWGGGDAAFLLTCGSFLLTVELF